MAKIEHPKERHHGAEVQTMWEEKPWLIGWKIIHFGATEGETCWETTL